MSRTATISILALSVALAGCTTVRSMRDRIVRSPPRCEDQAVPIYFQPGQSDLTRDGRQVLIDAAGRAKACTIKSISVVGLSDAAGDEAANFELSKKRAAAVSMALVEAGLPPRPLELAAAGEAGAVTSDGRVDPLRRRAEVTFHLAPPK